MASSPSLKEFSTDAVIANLGELARSIECHSSGPPSDGIGYAGAPLSVSFYLGEGTVNRYRAACIRGGHV